MKISVKCRKWIVLIAAIWIQAFTGTNFDFPSYSTQMKSKLKINQVQLNYMAMGSDIGKMFGWCSGVVLLYFPTWVVLFMAAFLGLFGYGLQWLIIQGHFSLPYFMVFLLSLSAGGSIPWFNTIVYLVKKLYRAYYSDGNPVEGPKYNLIEIKHHEEYPEESFAPTEKKNLLGWIFDMTIEKGRLKVLGEEHSVALLVTRCDFWLYYTAYFCGGAIGLVYSNNLGQIAQSLGYISETKALNSTRMYTTRTGMLMLSLVPLPIAFLLLVLSDHKTDLCVATGLIGICSGFLISTAVSLTSELFGSKSSGINHNILITNIPLGSLLYGIIAAVIYDDHIGISQKVDLDDKTVCIGRKCYHKTFIVWGCICLVGLASSCLLFLRTKPAYELYYKKRKDKQSPTCADN
uniref:Protein nuclear fusion defective 4-like n=1 Tax=Tanacetum cinerariifolium TaxID=118510 RepID=A0A6L2KN85_TANCI|nr:protein nuclear fusion defective 4-like [Tanacetum cinerariifolium]